MTKAVVIISGGLDSSTLAHAVKERGYDEVHGISFDYGQRHKKELEFATYQMGKLGGTHKIVDLSAISDLFADSGSSLVTDTDVPEGHYGEESMKATVVPNRNLIMISVAAGYAVSLGASCVAIGVHAGDHFIYPDCRPEFIVSAELTLLRANEGFISDGFHLLSPYILKSKNDIAAEAVRLGVDIANTWSCYNGGEIHCGKCGTCVERIEALNSPEVQEIDPDYVDPTEYEDPDFWKTALKRETV